MAKLDAIRREETKAALEGTKDAEANAKAEEIEALKTKTEALVKQALEAESRRIAAKAEQFD